MNTTKPIKLSNGQDRQRFRQLPGGDYWYPVASKRCKCCGCWYADLSELWSDKPDTCLLCDNPIVPCHKAVSS